MSLNSSCIFNIDEGKPGRQPHSQCHACWNYQGRHVGSFICHSTVNQINSKGIWFGDDPLAYYLPVFLLQVFLMFIFSRFIHLILNPSVHLAAIWAIQQSPEGKPIPEIYICGVLLTLIFLGFLGEVFGLNALVVSFFVGLAIPNGPPLGATLVMNDECFAIMIVTLVFVTKIVSPIVKTLYDPSKRFLAYKRWTIMHHQNNEELHILA
ncbi:hypothetical protein JHK82_031558 [Glycine max]|nr:hypothetical protein JHK82_031558 [Glycine max]